jgi:hypothetical protein
MNSIQKEPLIETNTIYLALSNKYNRDTAIKSLAEFGMNIKH